MANDIVTDEISLVLDEKFRNQLVGNFKIIKNSLNSINVDSIKLNDDNLKAAVAILKKYEVPIGYDSAGKIVDLSKEEG